MFFDARELFMLVVLVGVSGWVLRGLMMTWYRIHRDRDGHQSGKLEEIEERMRKVEAATTSLLVDVTSMREKQRFMAKLQASAATMESRQDKTGEGDLSPMVVQSIPAMPRAR